MDQTINSTLTLQEQLEQIQQLLAEAVEFYRANMKFKKLIIIACINVIPMIIVFTLVPLFLSIIKFVTSSAMNRNNKDIKTCASEIQSMLKQNGRNEKEISINLHAEGGVTKLVRSITGTPKIDNGFKVKIVTYNYKQNAAPELPTFNNSPQLTTKLSNSSLVGQLEKNKNKSFNGQSKGAMIIHGTYGTGKTYLAEEFAAHSFGKIGAYLQIQCGQIKMTENQQPLGEKAILRSKIENIKSLLKATSDKINDPNALIVLNFDETDVHPDFFQTLQDMLDNEFPAVTQANQFKTSRMLICTTNKTANLDSADQQTQKVSQRLTRFECVAYSPGEFLSLLDENHGKSWIKAISKNKNYNDAKINEIIMQLKTNIPTFVTEQLDGLINEIQQIQHIGQHSILDIANYMKGCPILQTKYNLLHLLLSNGTLECLEHQYSQETITKFNNFLRDPSGNNAQSLKEYLIENCKFIDFRTIERDVALPLINTPNATLAQLDATMNSTRRQVN